LQERVTTLRRLIGAVPIEAVQAILVTEFASALGRPLEPGTLTPAEARYAGQVARRLTAPAYLNLHSENGRTAPMRSLKISAGVMIHAAETEVDGHRIRASFRVRDDVIEEARLASDPARNWEKAETELRGVPLKAWLTELSK
jgi:hypothetical protein